MLAPPKLLILIALVDVSVLKKSLPQVESQVKPQVERRFGYASDKPLETMVEVEGNLGSAEFLTDYSRHRLPVVMRGAVRRSQAVRKWSDEYLLSLDKEYPTEYNEYRYEVRSGGNETTDAIFQSMHLRDFVKNYQSRDLYLISDIPKFLRRELQMPGALQCGEMGNALQAVGEPSKVMMGAGSTRSLPGFKISDEVFCVVRGRSEVVGFDRERYGRLLETGNDYDFSYFHLNPDRVDRDKYPKLLKVEYQRANLREGDCVYLPATWVRLVRFSPRTHIAYTIPFNHRHLEIIRDDACSDDFKLKKTLPLVTPRDNMLRYLERHDAMKWRGLHAVVSQGNRAFDHFTAYMTNMDVASFVKHPALLLSTIEMFIRIDVNADNYISDVEIRGLDQMHWEEMLSSAIRLEKQLTTLDMVLKERRQQSAKMRKTAISGGIRDDEDAHRVLDEVDAGKDVYQSMEENAKRVEKEEL